MGWNNRLDDNELGNLPPEAFGNTFDADGPFDPENSWLDTADEDDQRIAVKEWFLARYCDPAMNTPYNGQEGGYLFVNGGPYDPAEELHSRFSGVVSDEIIDEIVDDLHAEVGEMWAPVDYTPDYDDYLLVAPDSRDDPRIAFNQRMLEIEQILPLAAQTNPQIGKLLAQMAFGSVISAVEAYLAEITTFLVSADEGALQRVATKEFKEQKFTLAEIFSAPDQFRAKVLAHLSGKVIWHRLDTLKPTLEHGLKINLPDIGALMSAVNKRHDIVHRAGRTKEGRQVTLSAEQVEQLCLKAREFVTHLEAEITRAFPRKGEPEDF